MTNPDMENRFRDEEGNIDVIALYDEYFDKILRYVLHRTGDVEVSRDIAADVFFKVHKNRWKFVFSGAPVSAWLYRIAGNEVISFQRKQKYRPVTLERTLEQIDATPLALRGDLRNEIAEAQQAISQNAAFMRIHVHVKKLPNKYQEVVVLKYLEDKSICEIARLLGKKEGTVKSLISRGIVRLRRLAEGEKSFFLQNGLLVEASPNEGVN